MSRVSGHTFTGPFISRLVRPVLPEGRKHCYGSNERDERRGISHSVHLPEHGEVACLTSKGDKRGELKRKVSRFHQWILKRKGDTKVLPSRINWLLFIHLVANGK